MLELIRNLFFLCWLTILPGILIAQLLQLPNLRAPFTKFAIYFALGSSFWVLLLLWTSTLGLRWSPTAARSVGVLVSSLGIFFLFRQLQAGWRGFSFSLSSSLWLLVALLLFLLSLWTRNSHVSKLVMPNWVDSVHHTMIVQILVEEGRIPETFAPYMPSGQFTYHWGYHALTAWLAWFQGIDDPFDIVRLMLYVGQGLSILAMLMLYVAGRCLFSSRRAGVYTALFGGLVSWFPAYYISWGRYTHLTGVLLLAPLGIALWKLHTDRQHPWNWGILSALMSAGLLLIHVRVAVFFCIWAGVLAIYLLYRREWISLVRWAMVAGSAGLLTFPWFWRLLQSNQTTHLALLGEEAQTTWWNAINDVAWSLLWVPGVDEVMLIATGGLSALLNWGDSGEGLWTWAIIWLICTAAALAIYLWRRIGARFQSQLRSWRLPRLPLFPLLLIIAWCSATVVLLNLNRLGLPAVGFLTNNSAVITFFAPLSLFAGGMAAWVAGVLIPTRWAVTTLLALIITLGGWGSYQMRSIVNPATTFVRAADMRALAWIRESTPSDSLFAVNVKRWLGDTYAGSDAGYWIPVMSDRSTILPPALYTSVMPYPEVVQMNQFFATWSQVNNLDDAALRQQLREMGITHIYLGSRGGHLLLPSFFEEPYVQSVYSEGGVFIYKLLE